MNSYFPLFIDVSQFRTVFVGGGRIAERRVQTLQQFGARIIVIAPEITEGLKELVETNQILWENRGYREEDLSDPTIGMAIIATNDREVNHRAAMEAQKAGVPVSVADCKEESTFYFPGIARKGHIVAGVTASGLDHKAAARITGQIRKLLEEE